MKTKLFLLLSILFFHPGLAQKVKIKGIVTDTFSRPSFPKIVVNDTFNKFLKSERAEFESGADILDNKDLMTKADKNGYFEINAKLNDSLYFSSFRHDTEAHLVADLLKRDSIVIELQPKICVERNTCFEKGRVFVFIGEKINIKKAEDIYYCNYISLDLEYEAEYKIIETLYGSHKSDTINFTAYDHWDTPDFSNYDRVILYLAEYCGEYVHFKYEFDALYKTTDGRWASPYQPKKYRNIDSTFNIQPRKIEFETPLIYEIQKGHMKPIKEKYKEPYSKIEDGKLQIFYGNYPEELFELKKMNNRHIGKFFKE